MTHWPDDDEDDEDYDDGDPDTLAAAELPDPADTDPPGDDAETVRCPFCGRAVYEGADVCPGCGNFLGGTDAVPDRRPWWIVVGILLCLIGMLVTCAVRMW